MLPPLQLCALLLPTCTSALPALRRVHSRRSALIGLSAAARRAAPDMALMAIAGLIYPLAGLSMVAGLLVERLYELTRRALDRHARVLQ